MGLYAFDFSLPAQRFSCWPSFAEPAFVQSHLNRLPVFDQLIERGLLRQLVRLAISPAKAYYLTFLTCVEKSSGATNWALRGRGD